MRGLNPLTQSYWISPFIIFSDPKLPEENSVILKALRVIHAGQTAVKVKHLFISRQGMANHKWRGTHRWANPFDGPKGGASLIMFQTEGHIFVCLLDEARGRACETDCHRKVRTLVALILLGEQSLFHQLFLLHESKETSWHLEAWGDIFLLLTSATLTGKGFSINLIC